MSNIISNFQKLIKGGVGIRARGLENFSKINKRGGGIIIRYSRVRNFIIRDFGTQTLEDTMRCLIKFVQSGYIFLSKV